MLKKLLREVYKQARHARVGDM